MTRPMNKPEKVAMLKAHGWTRSESHGAQTWVSPDGREMGTLAYAIRRTLGVDLTPTFGAWLSRQTHRDDPVGDLARDHRATCPCWRCTCRRADRKGRPKTVTGVRRELDAHNADQGAYGALERAAAEWEAAYSHNPSDRVVCDECHANLIEIERIGHRGECESAGRHIGTWCDHTKPFPTCCRPVLREGDLAPWPA